MHFFMLFGSNVENAQEQEYVWVLAAVICNSKCLKVETSWPNYIVENKLNEHSKNNH